MKLRILTLCLALLLPAGIVAQEQPGAGIQATISAQIDAFKADDFARAFDFASPSIQQMFGSSERFGAMVRQGYPMVWRPAELRYLELREIDGALWQKVEIVDAAGDLHYLDYQMVPGQGGWKISGVQILQPPRLNV